MIKLNDKILEIISGGNNLGNLNLAERTRLLAVIADYEPVDHPGQIAVFCDRPNGEFGETLITLVSLHNFPGAQLNYINGIPYIYSADSHIPLTATYTEGDAISEEMQVTMAVF